MQYCIYIKLQKHIASENSCRKVFHKYALINKLKRQEMEINAINNDRRNRSLLGMKVLQQMSKSTVFVQREKRK